jgi:hypothetical protein
MIGAEIHRHVAQVVLDVFGQTALRFARHASTLESECKYIDREGCYQSRKSGQGWQLPLNQNERQSTDEYDPAKDHAHEKADERCPRTSQRTERPRSEQRGGDSDDQGTCEGSQTGRTPLQEKCEPGNDGHHQLRENDAHGEMTTGCKTVEQREAPVVSLEGGTRWFNGPRFNLEKYTSAVNNGTSEERP